MAFPARPAGAPLKQGASGDDVRLLQMLLRRLGNPLTGTGCFGPSTDTAVAHFQARTRLASTGIVDCTTASDASERPPRLPGSLDPDCSARNLRR